jgi:hypothetical protein
VPTREQKEPRIRGFEEPEPGVEQLALVGSKKVDVIEHQHHRLGTLRKLVACLDDGGQALTVNRGRSKRSREHIFDSTGRSSITLYDCAFKLSLPFHLVQQTASSNAIRAVKNETSRVGSALPQGAKGLLKGFQGSLSSDDTLQSSLRGAERKRWKTKGFIDFGGIAGTVVRIRVDQPLEQVGEFGRRSWQDDGAGDTESEKIGTNVDRASFEQFRSHEP